MNTRSLYWRAIYNDKTEVLQYEGKKENKYNELDRDRLERFDLIDYTTNKAIHSVWLNEGQSLIYRRRTLQPLKVTEDNPVQVIYLVGYKQTIMTPVGAKQFIILNYVHEDGSVALDGARDNLELYSFE